MSNRVTDPNKNSWSFTVTALFIIFGIHGFIIGWQIFKRDFQLGEFLIFAALTTIGFTFLGFLIDLARIQWRRFRNKS